MLFLAQLLSWGTEALVTGIQVPRGAVTAAEAMLSPSDVELGAGKRQKEQSTAGFCPHHPDLAPVCASSDHCYPLPPPSGTRASFQVLMTHPKLLKLPRQAAPAIAGHCTTIPSSYQGYVTHCCLPCYTERDFEGCCGYKKVSTLKNKLLFKRDATKF